MSLNFQFWKELEKMSLQVGWAGGMYVHMYVSVCIYVCTYACMYVCMYMCMCVCMHVCTYICMFVRGHVCMHVFAIYNIAISDNAHTEGTTIRVCGCVWVCVGVSESVCMIDLVECPINKSCHTFKKITWEITHSCAWNDSTQPVMGLLRLVGSLKSQVSFAEYSPFYRALLQKRPMILRSLLIVATPYRECTFHRFPVYEWVLSRVWIRHVTNMNVSFCAYGWLLPTA